MEEEDEYIGFGCPFCGTNVDFHAQYGGTVQTCPNCGDSVVVPREDGAPGTVLPLPLETPSLQLRRFREDDWEGLAQYLSDAELLQYVNHPPMNEQEIREWLDAVMGEKLTQAGERLHLAVATKEGDEVVGDVGIWLLDQEHLQASFDICLNKSVHGKGLATEAGKAVLDFCFAAIGLHRVSARCDSRNVAAKKLLARLGMRQEGEFLQAHRKLTEWIDTTSYAMLRRDYGLPG